MIRHLTTVVRQVDTYTSKKLIPFSQAKEKKKVKSGSPSASFLLEATGGHYDHGKWKVSYLPALFLLE